MVFKIIHYKTPNNIDIFEKWLEGIPDEKTQDKILAYIGRLRSGIFNNCKPIKTANGICELVIDYGPGYRVYYVKIAKDQLLIIMAGIKKEQKSDISKANKYYYHYLEREQKNGKVYKS